MRAGGGVGVGQTWWHNPGNIEPLTVDLMDHKPCAWVWRGQEPFDRLTGLPLPHGEDLFDLTGLRVQAADSAEAVQSLAAPSEFADLLAAESKMDSLRTEDASILMEDLSEVLAESGVSEATRQLFAQIVARMQAVEI